MESSLLTALGLFLLFEGIMPFAAPAQWRSIIERVSLMKDGQIRFMGLGAVVLGLVLLAI